MAKKGESGKKYASNEEIYIKGKIKNYPKYDLTLDEFNILRGSINVKSQFKYDIGLMIIPLIGLLISKILIALYIFANLAEDEELKFDNQSLLETISVIGFIILYYWYLSINAKIKMDSNRVQLEHVLDKLYYYWGLKK